MDPDDYPSPSPLARGSLFQEILQKRWSRRECLKLIGASAVTVCARPLGAAVPASASGLDFTEVSHGRDEYLHLPSGYSAQVLLRWGDPILPAAPDFDPTRQSGDAQRRQFGYNNDFVAYVPLGDANQGLLVVNHEYAASPLMFPGSPNPSKLTREQVEVDIAANGVSVAEIRRRGGRWQVVRDSGYARRLTPETPMRMAGPAAGHRRLLTPGSKDAVQSFGTYGNCAGGVTPWGTVLTAEENIQFYFTGDPKATPEAENHRRFGFRGNGLITWGRHYPRWHLQRQPAEPLHAGWIVEFDPRRPDSVPRKRTALGRCKHEGCGVWLNGDGRAVIYMGDDQRFEYIYRFVSRDTYDPQRSSDSLLDDGVLSVAEFHADGELTWHPLIYGRGPLTQANGFASQADVVIDVRKAADLVGATRMDRPEEVKVDPATGSVFAILTNNHLRRSAEPANPRARNWFGHIVEMLPPDGDHAAPRYRWDMFLRAGDPSRPGDGARYHPDVSRHGWFVAPDNCSFDSRGRMWVATDSGNISPHADGIWVMDVRGAERALPRHFLRAPVGAEVCSPCLTADDLTLFCAIQHPADGSTFDKPLTRWPDFDPSLPPRPSVIAVTRDDGGAIGT